jgi:glycerol-3-phosphate acyltransferase PlsY
MDLLPAAGLAAAAGYLCGSVPFSWLLVRGRTGRDLRTEGSGNVGATNAARVLGRGWFPLLVALDAVKGAGAVLLAGLIGGPPEGAGWVPVSAAVGAVLGHLLPAWLRFRGGKAVATGAGILAVLHPAAVVAGFAGFLVTAALFRFVSLGSVVAAVAAAGCASWLGRGSPVAERLPVESFLWLLAVLVLLRHLPNLRRIAAGSEPRIFVRGAAPPPPDGKEPPRAP